MLAPVDARSRKRGRRRAAGRRAGFRNWRAAQRLIERGAATTLADAATLGLMDRLEQFFGDSRSPTAEEVSHAFWGACHGGQRPAAQYLLDRGADLD